MREWFPNLGVATLFIGSGSSWQNGCIESFSGKLREELLNGEVFRTVGKTRIVTSWRRWGYNHIRPHGLHLR